MPKKKNQEKKEPNRKSRRKKKEKKKIEEKDESKPSKIDLNVYNLLFDEVNLFLKELNQLKTKQIKQKLILLDGKLIWIEKESQEDLLAEDGADDIIDMEMEMLELGLDLESADEMKQTFEPTADDFDLEAMKADLKETKSWGEDMKDLIKEIEEVDINKPIDDLMSKFVLYDVRTILERAINEVFRLEGKIKEQIKDGVEKEKVKKLFIDQRIAVKNSLKDILGKLKKEKPELLLTEKKIKEYKNLTQKEVTELKAKEEESFNEMVDELLE